MVRTLIVVPCCNEERRLQFGPFAEAVADDPGLNFLFVDDGSTDRTRALLEEFCRTREATCDLLALAENGGKAEAVRRGILAGAARNPRYVGFWDADLAAPLDEIPRFAEILDRRRDIDVVIGTRLRLSGHIIRRPFLRAVCGRVFARAASWVLGCRLQDTQCGAKLFRNGPHLPRLFAEPFSSRWIFDVEVFARLKGLRTAGGVWHSGIYELPLAAWEDVPGSRLRPRDFVRAFRDLAAIGFRYGGLRPQSQAAELTAAEEVAGVPEAAETAESPTGTLPLVRPAPVPRRDSRAA